MPTDCLKRKNAFTLVEALVTIVILVIAILGLFQIFIYGSKLNEVAGNMTFAMNEAQNKMEEIKDHDFDDIVTDFSSSGTPGDTFSIAQPNGMGVIYIDSSNPKLLELAIVVSWRHKDGRII